MTQKIRIPTEPEIRQTSERMRQVCALADEAMDSLDELLALIKKEGRLPATRARKAVSPGD